MQSTSTIKANLGCTMLLSVRQMKVTKIILLCQILMVKNSPSFEVNMAISLTSNLFFTRDLPGVALVINSITQK